VQVQGTFWRIARGFPLPRAGEGQGEGVLGRNRAKGFILTLVSSPHDFDGFMTQPRPTPQIQTD
jgi:hypothetical protein